VEQIIGFIKEAWRDQLFLQLGPLEKKKQLLPLKMYGLSRT